MNRIITMMVAACSVLAVSAADWHAKVSDCAQDPAQLKQMIGTLSAADQTAFLAAVNEAIAKMPGSDEVKAAKFLDANRAAVVGATKENRTAVLAEVYATVPPEYLTVINEEFAKNPFSRNANSANPISNENFQSIAVGVMEKIVARCATASDGNGAVRAAFAAMMFERASNGQEGIRDALVATLPAAVRETAKSEWFPAAMGEGREKTYDPMLGVSEAGEEPNHEAVLNLASSPVVTVGQGGVVQLSESQGADGGLSAGAVAFAAPGIVGAAQLDPSDTGLERIPRAAVFSEVPVNLTPVLNANGQIATQTYTDQAGVTRVEELYVTRTGKVVAKTRAGNGKVVYVDPVTRQVIVNPTNVEKRDEPARYVK